MSDKYIAYKKKRDLSYDITLEQVDQLESKIDKILRDVETHKQTYKVATGRPKWPQFDTRDLDFQSVLVRVLQSGKMTECQHRQLRITMEKVYGNNAKLETVLFNQ